MYFCPKGLFDKKKKKGVVGMMHMHSFRADFRLEKKGIWTSVLLLNCFFNCELEVRLLNYPNWTSIAQVMVHLISGIVII